MTLAISTSWNALCHTEGKPIIDEIKALRIDHVELSFNLTAAIVDDIETLAAQEYIHVTSLHNYCPVPRGLSRTEALPDFFSLSSPNEEQRRQALEYTKISIDTARRIGAQAVVLHCGRVDSRDATKKLIELYARGKKDSLEFATLRECALKERRDLVAPYLRSILRSLEELDRYARKAGIALGIENRYYIREIPSFAEIGIILEEFRGSQLFYWHDCGHAQLMETVGIARHRDFLEAYGSRLIGIHLHTIVNGHDHRAPLQDGEIEFPMLVPFVKKETLKVIEVHGEVPAPQLRESVDFLEKLFP